MHHLKRGITLAMSYEVEVKVPISDVNAIEKTILRAGGRRLNSEIQTDIYYDHPCRTFSQTDEAVRLRTREPLDALPSDSSRLSATELTYKGPKVDKTTKTRLEFTSGVTDAGAITSILQNTGFKHVAIIKKRRIFFDVSGITVSIDDVDGVGLFIELESIAHSKKSVQAAKEKVLTLVEHLGLDPKMTVRDSYLELYLNRAH
jgi:adenylate cyclase class 2